MAEDTVWADTADQLIGGIAHSLGSRCTVVRVAADAQVYDAAAGRELLAAESAQLEGLVRALRLLQRRWRAEPEGVAAGAALRAAVELHRLHATLGTVRVAADVADGVPAVLAVPTLLTHALLLLLTAAKRSALGASAEGVRVRCSGDADWLRVVVEPVSLSVAAGEVAVVRAWAERMGGALDAPEPPQSPEVSETRAAAAHPSGCTLRVPTLAAARRAARAHANG